MPNIKNKFRRYWKKKEHQMHCNIHVSCNKADKQRAKNFKNYFKETNMRGCWNAPLKHSLTFNVCRTHIKQLPEILNRNIHFWLMVLCQWGNFNGFLNQVYLRTHSYLMPYTTLKNNLFYTDPKDLIFPLYGKVPFREDEFMAFIDELHNNKEIDYKVYLHDVITDTKVPFVREHFKLLVHKQNSISNLSIAYKKNYSYITRVVYFILTENTTYFKLLY